MTQPAAPVHGDFLEIALLHWGSWKLTCADDDIIVGRFERRSRPLKIAQLLLAPFEELERLSVSQNNKNVS